MARPRRERYRAWPFGLEGKRHMKRIFCCFALLGCCALATTGCDDDANTGDDDMTDSGPDLDTGNVETDAGPAVDSGPGEVDSGPGEADSGPVEADSGPVDIDAGPAETDSGPVEVDAGPVEEVEVFDCGGITPDEVIGTSGFAFSPSEVTISAGGVVKFETPGNHNMVSGTPSSPDGKFTTGTPGDTMCLRFNVVGEYPFYCGVHNSMRGTVTVE